MDGGVHRGHNQWGARDAILDFRAIHGIEDAPHVIHDIDSYGAWFQKARQVKVHRKQYAHSVRTSNYTALQPSPKLTRADHERLTDGYEAHAKNGAKEAGPRNTKPLTGVTRGGRGGGGGQGRSGAGAAGGRPAERDSSSYSRLTCFAMQLFGR